MEQLSLLLFLCFSMLVGSFLSGTIPLIFKLSDSKSRLLALMGSGILVGTALAVIIPEGVSSIYSQTSSLAAGHNHLSPSTPMEHARERDPEAVLPHDTPPKQEPATWVIGPSLVVGFVLMLIIEQFSIYLASGQESSHGHSTNLGGNCCQRKPLDYSLANQSDDEDEIIQYDNRDLDREQMEVASSQPNPSNGETMPIMETSIHSTTRVSIRNLDNTTSGLESESGGASSRSLMKPKVTPTLGLVIHASADGIALGAAATSSRGQVEMIIFLAIMLHKAPAAFSLVVFLLHMGLKHSTIRRHLLAFSLSAPIAALVTYFSLSQSSKETMQESNATGIAMLFSAGTFLFVATVHVLPELLQNKSLNKQELLFLIGGSFLPIILAQTI